MMSDRPVAPVPPVPTLCALPPIPAQIIRFALASLALAALSLPLMAQSPTTEQVFERFVEEFGASVYPYARRGAQPLGITGFEVYAEISGRDFDQQAFSAVVDGLDDPLVPVRVGVRKGLFGGIDIGASYAEVIDLDYSAWAFDVQKALLEPGAFRPGLGLRLAYTDGDLGNDLTFRQYGGELIVSKGFTVIAIFGGAGLVRSEGDLRNFGVIGSRLESSATTSVLFAGLRLNLLLPKFTLTVEKADQVQASLAVAFGW